METPLADRIDALLPQTQCTRCGFAACRPYAQAIAEGRADFDRCSPGGAPTLLALAGLLDRPGKPLDPEVGPYRPHAVASIDAERCIGCTLCIEACPVDAILGASRQLHAVVESLCSGCELCVAPCPVDCIELRPTGRAWTRPEADAAGARHQARLARLARGERLDQRSRPPGAEDAKAARGRAVTAALARARARRQVGTGGG